MVSTIRINTLFLFFCFVLSTPALASPSPDNLKWKGEVISPRCFLAINPMGDDDVTEVALSKCQPGDKPKAETTDSQTWFSVDVKDTETPDDEALTQNIGYHIVGTLNEGYVVDVLYNGGGSGWFSSVWLVSLENDVLKRVKVYQGGGDRCNGGVVSSSIENGHVLIESNITPGDFTQVAYQEDKGIKAYDDLEASAMSCVATVTINDEDKLVKVKLAKDFLEEGRDPEMVKGYRYQPCFDKLLSEQIKTKTELDPSEFKNFVDRFLTTCTKQ